jgi:hypothetical protein
MPLLLQILLQMLASPCGSAVIPCMATDAVLTFDSEMLARLLKCLADQLWCPGVLLPVSMAAAALKAPNTIVAVADAQCHGAPGARSGQYQLPQQCYFWNW